MVISLSIEITWPIHEMRKIFFFSFKGYGIAEHLREYVMLEQSMPNTSLFSSLYFDQPKICKIILDYSYYVQKTHL